MTKQRFPDGQRVGRKFEEVPNSWKGVKNAGTEAENTEEVLAGGK